jgi:hypothetical protein
VGESIKETYVTVSELERKMDYLQTQFRKGESVQNKRLEMGKNNFFQHWLL